MVINRYEEMFILDLFYFILFIIFFFFFFFLAFCIVCCSENSVRLKSNITQYGEILISQLSG